MVAIDTDITGGGSGGTVANAGDGDDGDDCL